MAAVIVLTIINVICMTVGFFAGALWMDERRAKDEV